MKRETASPRSAFRHRVLLVETDSAAVHQIALALGSEVALIAVSSAARGLKLLRLGEHFDAILYDLETPDASGTAFYDDACQIDALNQARVIMIARGSAATCWAKVARLARPSLAKPVDPTALRLALAYVVRDTDRAQLDLTMTLFGLDADVLNTTAVPASVDEDPRTPFGPFYPSPLQASVTHAERLARAMSDALDAILDSPAFDPNEPTDAEVWLVGRTEEVEAFVAEIVGDWRRGALDLASAAAVLDRYIESMHRGMLASLSQGTPLPCCGAVDLMATGVSETRARTFPHVPVTIETPTPS